MTVRLACVAIGYVFGLFQTAYFFGKLVGTDIRQHGSGNLGTTNTLRVLGTKAGLIVLLGDIAKTILAILCTRALFGAQYESIRYLLKVYTAAGVILGHDFPVWLKFKGGKGIACTAGMILAFHWTYIVMGVLMFFPVFFTLHFVSLGSLLVNLGLVAWTVFCGQSGYLFSEMTAGQRLELYAVIFCIAALAWFQHRKNIVRLLRGEEGKVYLKKKPQSETQ